jgi:hypothetical protein
VYGEGVVVGSQGGKDGNGVGDAVAYKGDIFDAVLNPGDVLLGGEIWEEL